MNDTGPTRRESALGICAAGAMALAAGSGMAASAGGLSLCRGVNIYHMMQSAARSSEGEVIWPPFAGPEHDMPDAQILALRRAGFDFVRLTLAPDVFLRASGANAQALYARLRTDVRRFTERGFQVVVVMMPGNSLMGFRNADVAANLHGVFDALCEVVGLCAAALRDIAPGRVAMEPLNEPALGGLEELRWGGMQQRLHQAVRAAAPQMPVVLTGARSGGFEGLLNLDPSPYRGSNVFYSFHYYDPYIFTHQHIGNSLRYLSGVTWPPRPEDLAGALGRVQLTVAGDTKLSPATKIEAQASARGLLTDYYRSGLDARTPASDFARVAAWASAHGIDRRRILLGEFGVTRTLGGYAGAPDADALRWLSTIRSTAERNGFAWALWAFSGPVTMTLANEYPARTFDPGVLGALGLKEVQP